MSEATWAGFGQHGMRADMNHDETANMDFIMSFYRHLGRNVAPGHRKVYDERVKPKFEKENGREPETRHEVRKAMLKDPYFQFWSHLRLYGQGKSYDIRREIINRQLSDLIEEAKPRDDDLGTVEIDPDFEVPRYQKALDMHWMPGSYYTERAEGDVAAGAMYDTGGLYIALSGTIGKYNDGAGHAVVHWLNENHPEFKPERVLDEGCTAGGNTLPFKYAWPDAEVNAIDIGAPVLRYAHRRAESLGYEIHFAQRDAEHTEYEPESFDLVVSTMFLHETSNRAVHNIVEECHRLLKPGGLMVHVEQPPFKWFDDPFDQFIRDWDTHNNNEPFWGPMHDMDLPDVARRAGFHDDDIIMEMAKYCSPTDDNPYREAPGGWFIFGAWKR